MQKKSNAKSFNKPRLSPSIQVLSNPNNQEEFIEREYKTYGRKSDESGVSYASGKPAAHDSVESVLHNLRFEGNSGENAAGKNTQAEEASSTSEHGQKHTKSDKTKIRRGKKSTESKKSKTSSAVSGVITDRSELSLTQKPPEKSSSFGSMDRPSDNYLLKKTDEITCFNVRDETNIKKEFSLPRFAERLELSESFMRMFSARTKDDVDFRRRTESDTDETVGEPLGSDFRFRSSSLLEAAEGKIKKTKETNFKDEDKGLGENYAFDKNYKGIHLLGFSFSKLKRKMKRDDIENNDEMDDPLTSRVTANQDLKIKEFIRYLFFYVIFVIIMTSVALNMVSPNMYYFRDLTEELFFDTPNGESTNNFSSHGHGEATRAAQYENDDHPKKTLRHSNTYGDFWAFAESTMINMFYWKFLNSLIDPSSHTAADDKKMFYENQILGVPRIRQVRVRPDSCLINANLRRFFENCYYYYNIFTEETRPIRNNMSNSVTASAWVYTEAKTLGTSNYWGIMSIYGGGGYYLDFSTDKETTQRKIQELKENFWVSRATRAIFIDFNLYNANVNLFCLCKIVLEFPPLGGMIPQADFHSLKLIRYLNSFDFFILACELLLFIFIGYFSYETYKIFRDQKSSFFFVWWNYFDLLFLILLYVFALLSIIRYVVSRNVLWTLANHDSEYTELGHLRDLQINYNNLIAILLFVTWIKLFRFLTFNVVMMEFKRTLRRSFKEILGFFPMFLVMFEAFVLLAYLLFGNQVKDYNTLWSSCLSLLQAFLGEFEYRQIQESNRILGPVFYIAFIFFIFFVLLNVFIAIINDAYSSVKSEVISETPKVGKYLKRGFLNLLGMSCCGLDRKIEKRDLLKKKVIYAEVIQALKNAGFSEVEIKIFFSKYDIDVHSALDEKTKRQLIVDLELKRFDFSENAEQFQIKSLRRKIDYLNERIDEIEVNLQPIIDKVDVLIKRL